LPPSTKGATIDLRDFEKAAKRQGWTISRTRRGHVVFTPPDVTVPPAVHSGTPGDQAALRNLLADLRRKGLVWPPRGKGKRWKRWKG
jgi:predicted RNA binding protein YcfA (HicA-like mRNA interferase family)